jgi:hypothetical protein
VQRALQLIFAEVSVTKKTFYNSYAKVTKLFLSLPTVGQKKLDGFSSGNFFADNSNICE